MDALSEWVSFVLCALVGGALLVVIIRVITRRRIRRSARGALRPFADAAATDAYGWAPAAQERSGEIIANDRAHSLPEDFRDEKRD
ncbi:hypothetical protein [Mycetocola sp. JXN-3]|uniref:hypothetical protein n=1 Tax=Mycetocola sp. JXN-3 TaxID=2116510 RepID=UPI00165CF55E|nr:hypothetical protein [Mycetocola sp. JXN-3]